MPEIRKPRLTSKVARGLSTVATEAESMVSERQGHGEDHPEDGDEYAAIDYLRALEAWYWHKHGETG